MVTFTVSSVVMLAVIIVMAIYGRRAARRRGGEIEKVEGYIDSAAQVANRRHKVRTGAASPAILKMMREQPRLKQ